MNIRREEYLKDPCRASSLPFWKTELTEIPGHLSVLRDDLFSAEDCPGRDEPYFKLRHDLGAVPAPVLPAPFETAACGMEAYARHISGCYAEEHVSLEELRAYQRRPVYDPALWLAVIDPARRAIVASGIAEIDTRIGEGVLEWIQVSPGYRRRGLGRYLVCELLRRMKGRADFAMVSGRLNSPDDPLALYLACGFRDPVIWHVVSAERT